MSAESGNASQEQPIEIYDGCESVTCPNPKCNQVLMDLDEVFLEGNSEIDCRKCKQPAEHVASLSFRKRPSKSIYVFKCAPCKIKFTRTIPAMKRHCPRCKEEIYMFWNLLLGLPGHSSRQPRRKALLQSA